jgi:hypothetical protein
MSRCPMDGFTKIKSVSSIFRCEMKSNVGIDLPISLAFSFGVWCILSLFLVKNFFLFYSSLANQVVMYWTTTSLFI